MRKLLALTAVLALVAVAASPAFAGSTPKPLSVSLKDNFFSPKKKTIKSGTKVTWTWRGEVDHNVTLATEGVKGAPKGVKPSKFSSKTQTTGKPFVRTLKTPGTYFFFCSLHSGMEQTLKVTK